MTEDLDLPPGWDKSHLEAYRDGWADALQWALGKTEEELLEVLEGGDASDGAVSE